MMPCRVCYFPMLEGQVPEVQSWMDGIRSRFDVIPILLPALDWNDDLTPWPADPIFKKGKAFGGKAEAYLDRLESEIIPSLERGLQPDERWLVGISLSGLFAVWAAARSLLFNRIASVSGSFWYPGFTEWLRGQTLQAESVYLSLGDKETLSRNPHLKDIAAETAAVVNILENKGIRTTFEWTEGTHFGPVLPRLDKALAALAQ